MKLAFINICSPKPRQFAELFQSLFGGTAYYESGLWVWEVSWLPAVRIQTGNAGDPESYHLALKGSKEEFAKKIRQMNNPTLTHLDRIDLWKIYDEDGSFIGYISVTEE